MERCSYFIQNKALFGSYPTQEAVEELEANGVRYFVDLTCPGERRISPYTTKYSYLRYSIRDHKVPSDWCSFAQFILKLCATIKKLDTGELVYVHCKGGHGRSGIVVSSVLCYLYKIMPTEALRLTGEYHAQRREMREKRRRLGAPPGVYQKDFVCQFFRALYFYKAYNRGITAGMSNFSIHSVEVPDLGTFPTSEAAFHAFKNPENKEYVRKQEMAFTPHISKRLGKSCHVRDDWEEKKDHAMYKVLTLKFKQHEDIRQNLMNTGLRPLIEHGPDGYWGDGRDGRGKNMLGKLLVRIRNKLYTKE